MQFLARDAERILPVMFGGELRILRWGNRRSESESLPSTLWTQLATVEAVGWKDASVEEVVIPASLGLDGGIWFAVKTGVRSLFVVDEKGERRFFVVCGQASYD